MAKNEDDKIKHILTDPKLSAVKTMLEKDTQSTACSFSMRDAANGKKPKTSCAKTNLH